MGLRNWFKGKDDVFLNLLTAQAEKTLAGMAALEAYVNAATPEGAERVRQAEKEADELRRILLDELDRTFVTPIDREDIFALSRAIDDVMDYAFTTVEEMGILGVSSDEHLVRMVGLTRKAAEEILLSMQRLKNHPSVAVEHARRAKKRENQVERVYRQAVADLFHGPEDVHHIMEMLRRREVYRHVSNAADRGDEAADLIGRIVMKMT